MSLETIFMVYNLVRGEEMPTIPLSHAKAKLTKLLSQVEELGEEVVITRSGRPAGVLLSFSEYEGLLETLEILADDELAQLVKAGLEEAARGEVVAGEDVWRGLDDPLHP
jgi:prevent-host-death family protein